MGDFLLRSAVEAQVRAAAAAEIDSRPPRGAEREEGQALRGRRALMVAALTVGFLLVPSFAWAGVPNPGPQAPPGLADDANLFLGWLKYIGLAAGVGGLFICGIMMMVGRRNRSNLAADGASGIMWVIGGLSVISLAAGVVGVVLT